MPSPHTSVCVVTSWCPSAATYEDRDLAVEWTLADAFLGPCFFSLPTGAERRGRLKRPMMIKFTSTQNIAAPTELTKVMGMECCRSQGRRVTMSCSMAIIWKWVARMAHT